MKSMHIEITDEQAGAELRRRRSALGLTIHDVVKHFNAYWTECLKASEITRIETGNWNLYDDLTACMLNALYTDKEQEIGKDN